ncbi:MAG: glycosyltransferase, partial [Ilumatobacteraceae bacterium]
EAVADGQTGIVVRHPDDVEEVVTAFTTLLDDPALRARMGAAGRARAEAEFSYDVLARRLGESLGALAQ